MMDRKCKNCKWFEYLEENETERNKAKSDAPNSIDDFNYAYGGFCHRYPPSFIGEVDTDGLGQSELPIVVEQDWCGEFESKEKNKPKAP